MSSIRNDLKNCSQMLATVNNDAYYVPAFINIIVSVVAFVFSFIIFTKSTFCQMVYHQNVKIVLTVLVLNNMVIASDTLYNFTTFLIKTYTKINECDIFFKTAECSTIRKCFIFAFVFQTCSHVLLVVERTWATYRLSKYNNDNCVISALGLLISGLVSVIVVVFVTGDEQDEWMTTCIAFSTTSIGDNMFVIFRIQALTETLCFVAYCWLSNANNTQKRHCNDLNDQYQLSENQQMIRQFSPLFLLSTGLISGYLIAVQFLRAFRAFIPPIWYRTISVTVFLVPHISCFSLVIIYYMLRAIAYDRKIKRLNSIRSPHMESRAHMQNVLRMWEDSSPRKSN